MEEAAFIPKEVVYSAILPLIGVDKTAVFGISTPSDDGNYYTILLNSRKENGDSVFRTIPVAMACEECQKAGKVAECPHKSTELPPWKPADRQEIQRAMMPPEQFAMETLGLIPGKANIAFTRADIQKLFAGREQDVFVPGRSYIYVACDPTAGHGSRLALVAFMWAREEYDDPYQPLRRPQQRPPPQQQQVDGSTTTSPRPAEEDEQLVV